MPQFDFTSRRGLTLTGRLELPPRPIRAYAIFAHCFTCSKNVKAATQVSSELADHGIAVLRFDFTGLGNSEGDFANSNFTSNVTDLVDAANALKEQYNAPMLLIGHSFGGAAALMAAGQIESVRAVATIGAPSEPAHVERLIGLSKTQSYEDGSATISLGGRELRIGADFVKDLRSNRVADRLPRLHKPILIFHSPTDSIVNIEQAKKLYEAAKHPKSFVSVNDADHMLSNPSDAKFVAATLAAWVDRYLPAPKPSDEIVDGVVEVHEQKTKYTQSIRTSRHQFLADEPVSVGGADLGPNPYELLLASLGSCITMTLRMYADRKQWPVQGITVRLQHSRIHAKDGADCESLDGRIDQIDVAVIVKGELNEAQVKRLAEIAEKCPVHRTLMREKSVRTHIQLDETPSK